MENNKKKKEKLLRDINRGTKAGKKNNSSTSGGLFDFVVDDSFDAKSSAKSGKKSASNKNVGSSASGKAGKSGAVKSDDMKVKNNTAAAKKGKPAFTNEDALKDNVKLKEIISREKSSYKKSGNGKSGNDDGLLDNFNKYVKRLKIRWNSMDDITKYKRVGATIVCFLLVVLVFGIIASGISSNKDTKSSTDKTGKTDSDVVNDTTTEEASENASTDSDNPLIELDNEDVKTLMDKYLTALRDNDIDTLKSIDMCSDSYESTSSYKNVASIIEEYQNIKYYSKNGPYENGYLVFAVVDIKFKGVTHTCQGMYNVVVRLQEDGTYKIDTTPDDDIEDDDAADSLLKLKASEDVLNLCDEVNKQYDDDIAADADLKAFVEKNILGGGNAEDVTPNSDSESEETAADEEATTAEEITTEEPTDELEVEEE